MSQIGSRQSLETRRAEDQGPPPGVASRRPAAALRTLVSSYSGYDLTDMEPGEIRGLPSRSLTLIVALDEPISIVSMPDRRLPPGSFWSMIGGLHTSPAVIGHRGRQHGVQVDLTPIGACSVLGILPGEVGSAVVALADVAPRLASALEQQLNDAGSWDACFDLLDDAFLATASERVALAPSVQAAWALLAASHGTIAVETLARSVGSSSRHLVAPVPPRARDLTQGGRSGDAIRARASAVAITTGADDCVSRGDVRLRRPGAHDSGLACVRRVEPWAVASPGTPIRSRRAVLRGPDSVT